MYSSSVQGPSVPVPLARGPCSGGTCSTDGFFDRQYPTAAHASLAMVAEVGFMNRVVNSMLGATACKEGRITPL